MNTQIIRMLLVVLLSVPITAYAQNSKQSDAEKSALGLFEEENPLALKMHYSNKDLKKNTNDSTYIKSELSYQEQDSSWKTLPVELRARGNFRRANCYFVPVKISIKKKDYKHTKFDGHKKLKLVLPCLMEKDNNDNVLKEYIAYKLYALISPYHFNVRLVHLKLTEPKGKREKTYDIKGFLIEDDKRIAKAFNGKIMERSIHPMAQETLCSIRCEFFQFMIGNTDFSNMEQHNAKLLYVDKKIYPIPYDFDMSGLVNASYSVVSETMRNTSNIHSVTQRAYRGFKRDLTLIEQVRQEYMQQKSNMLQVFDALKPEFKNNSEFEKAKNYIQSFFDILANDAKFKSKVLMKLRS